MADRYAEGLEMALPEKVRRVMDMPKGSTWGDAIVLARMREAITRGGTFAAKEIADRVEGKATQRVDIVPTNQRKIEIAVKFTQAPITNPQALLDGKAEAETQETIDVQAKLVEDTAEESNSNLRSQHHTESTESPDEPQDVVDATDSESR